MKLDFKAERILRSRERTTPPAEHPELWRKALGWLNLKRRLRQVFAGIFLGSVAFAITFRQLFPDYGLAYPQVLEVEAAVAFILLYFFVPELARGKRGGPVSPVLARLRRSAGHAWLMLRRAAFMALLAAASTLPLVLVRPLGSNTQVELAEQQPPALWAAHFFTGEAAFFCYLWIAVVVAYALHVAIGSSFWYRLLLICFAVATLPQTAALWEPVGFYIPAIRAESLKLLLHSYGPQGAIIGFHRLLDNPPPYLSTLHPALIEGILLARRLLLTGIAACVLSLVGSAVAAFRRGCTAGAASRTVPSSISRHQRLLPHLLASIIIIALTAVVVLFFGGYTTTVPSAVTAEPIAVFTLVLIAVIGYLIARTSADYLRERRGNYPTLPLSHLMRSHLALTASYAFALVSWGGVNIGVLVWLLGLGWTSFLAVIGLLLISGSAMVLIGLGVIAFARLTPGRRYSALGTGLLAAVSLEAAVFLLYPPERPSMLLEGQKAGWQGLSPILNQLLLLEGVNYPAAFGRWLNLAELARGEPTMLSWLAGCILAVLFVLVGLIWLLMRACRRFA
ncbi:MAG: hypothetical protein B1H03_02930 [Planctomycetales bacterium 4484_113]|nr:MAG: hypothetical protein B1H03_02930 [Planctomycetales bacterium 4484_113]